MTLSCVKRFNEDDAYCQLFLRSLNSNGDPVAALPGVHESLAFRKEWEINDLNESSFPAHFKESTGVYYKGHDKDGNPILYMNMEKDTPKDEVKATKQYIAWLFDQHEKEDPETMCVVLLDMSGAGGSLLPTIKFICKRLPAGPKESPYPDGSL